MYKYSEKDTQFLVERVDQFEKQMNRHLSGELDEDKLSDLFGKLSDLKHK